MLFIFQINTKFPQFTNINFQKLKCSVDLSDLSPLNYVFNLI